MTEVIAATDATLASVVRERQRQIWTALSPRAALKFQAALTKTAWGRRHQQTMVLTRRGTIAASAERYELALVVDGRAVTACGIGAVCQHAFSASADIARELINRVADEAAQRGQRVTLLFDSPAIAGTTIDGFSHWPMPRQTIRVIEATRYGAPMTTVRGGEERDTAAIADIDHLAATPLRCHLDRGIDFIRYVVARQRLLGGLGPAQQRQLHFYIAEEGITAAAYVVISEADGDWSLDACGDRDPSGARVGALMQALIAREPSRARPRIVACLPAHFRPPQIEVLTSEAEGEGLRVHGLFDEMPAEPNAETMHYWRSDLL